MNYASVIFSQHALDQLKARRISKQQVIRALKEAKRNYPSKGKLVVEAKTATGAVLRVVYIERLEGPEVVTAVVRNRGSHWEAQRKSHMKIKLDTNVNALYLSLQDGKVHQTVEVEEGVYMDLAKDGQVLGLEFIDANDFVGFIDRRGGLVDIPERIEDLSAAFLATA